MCEDQNGAFLNELQQTTLQTLDQEDFDTALSRRFSSHEMAVHFPFQCPPGCTRKLVQFPGNSSASCQAPHTTTSSIHLHQIAFDDQPLFFARDVALKEEQLTAGTLARYIQIAKNCTRYHTCPNLNQTAGVPPPDPAVKDPRPPENLSPRQKGSEQGGACCGSGPDPAPMGVCDDTPRGEKLYPNTSGLHPGTPGRHPLPDAPPTYLSSIKEAQPKLPTAKGHHTN